MSNPSKQKGTGGETELLRILNEKGFRFRRTSPTLPFDLIQEGVEAYDDDPLEVLATRPDRGRWLVTMNLDDFMSVLSVRYRVHIESKRYARFSLHSIFEKKFGKAS